MHIVAKVNEVALCDDDLQTLHTILPPTNTVLSPVYPSVVLHIAFTTLHITATRSSATAERQRVSYTRLSRLTHGSCTSL